MNDLMKYQKCCHILQALLSNFSRWVVIFHLNSYFSILINIFQGEDRMFWN